MKKFVQFFIAVLFFMQYTMAAAGSYKPQDIKAEIVFADSVKPGQNASGEIKIFSNSRKPVATVVQVFFSDEAIESVLLKDKGALSRVKGGWIYYWRVSPSQSRLGGLKFEVKIAQKTGKYLLAKVFARSGAELASKSVLVRYPSETAVPRPTQTLTPSPTATATSIPPTYTPTALPPTATLTPEPTATSTELPLRPLEWSAAYPNPIIYGARSMKIVVTVSNPAGVDQEFDTQTVFYYQSGGMKPEFTVSVSGGEMTMYGAETLRVLWKGIVPAGSSMTLVVDTYSGTGLGTFPLFDTFESGSGKVDLSAWITLIQGTEPPSGYMKMWGQRGENVVLSDEYFSLTTTLYSPIASQFVVAGVQSTCPIEGLPTGSVSPYPVSYVQFLYYVHVFPGLKPEGWVGEYTISCKLETSFYLLGHPETSYPVSTDYILIIP